MKRLLCIIGSMNAGGAETFLMKIYRNLNKNDYQMDFVVAIESEGIYDKEIENYGGIIYHIVPKSKNPIRNFTDIKNIVKDNQYNYVLRVSQHSLSALELLAARFGGARITVFRSSNSNTTSNKRLNTIMHKLCMFMPQKFANVRIAPSTEAAEFMFGKNCITNGNAKILHNAIDMDIYKFDMNARKKYRKIFEIENKIVIGHIGRFNRQKNHKFLINIFYKIIEMNKDVILMLVGSGELEDEVKQRFKELGIENRVIFTGVRKDIPQLLSAMDVFVFPSLYEGMPNTVIEAQATGLPCVISDAITKEADITGLVTYLSLDESVDTWAKTILKKSMIQRQCTKENFIKHKYDIASSTEEFVNLIFREE